MKQQNMQLELWKAAQQEAFERRQCRRERDRERRANRRAYYAAWLLLIAATSITAWGLLSHPIP